jgi:hypothetical protein
MPFFIRQENCPVPGLTMFGERGEERRREEKTG